MKDAVKNLETRLQNGSEQIEKAKQAGTDTRLWEEFWIKLLREYEAVCNERIDGA